MAVLQASKQASSMQPWGTSREISGGFFNNNNNIFISYIKYTSITPPANSKANRGRWCVDDARFITNGWSEKKSTIFIIKKRNKIKKVSHERNWDKIEAAI